ncbi:TPA: hypothetical protein GRI67_00030 [Vibrio parahaemolyticus]|nr:hypothetical protein [Vibrio parahaemolyticus]HAS6751884.1 hypothetical protein [Vibrio parahaemolyticus]HAS6774428.1 hypothetical protein [Vibrio parahaemolyticus]
MINENKGTEIFNEIQTKLFSRMNPASTKIDFFEYMFSTYFRQEDFDKVSSTNPIDNGKYVSSWIVAGEQKESVTLIQPDTKISKKNGGGNLKVVRQSREFYHKVFEIFNEEYWVINLWMNVYEANKNYRLGREVTRGFILNSIYSVAEYAAGKSNGQLTKSGLNKVCPARDNFYKRTLSKPQIVSRIREQARPQLKAHTAGNKPKDGEKLLVQFIKDVENDSVTNYDLSNLAPLYEAVKILDDKVLKQSLEGSFGLLFRPYRRHLKKPKASESFNPIRS